MSLTPREFLSKLDAHGIRVYVQDGDLKVRAPKGILTPAVVASIQAAKPRLLTLAFPKVIEDVRLAALRFQIPAGIRLCPGHTTHDSNRFVLLTYGCLSIAKQVWGEAWRQKHDYNIRAADLETVAAWWHENKPQVDTQGRIERT